MKIAIITGLLKKIWRIILPLLKSALLEVLADKAALNVAEKIVLKYVPAVISGDEKFEKAKADIKAELAELGKHYSSAALSILTEAVYQSLKAKGLS